MYFKDKFGVDTEGTLFASGVHISGTISSSNATITGGSITLNGIPIKYLSLTARSDYNLWSYSGSGICIGGLYMSKTFCGFMYYESGSYKVNPVGGNSGTGTITACSDWNVIPHPPAQTI
jgi:hypothetical protein